MICKSTFMFHARPLRFTTFGGISWVCDRLFFIQPQRLHSIFVDGACWAVCFCCWSSPIWDINVMIFWVCVMEYMCVRQDICLHCHLKKLQRVESKSMLTLRGKSPQCDSSKKGWTHDAASCRITCLSHYQLNYSGLWRIRYKTKRKQTQTKRVNLSAQCFCLKNKKCLLYQCWTD